MKWNEEEEEGKKTLWMDLIASTQNLPADYWYCCSMVCVCVCVRASAYIILATKNDRAPVEFPTNFFALHYRSRKKNEKPNE